MNYCRFTAYVQGRCTIGPITADSSEEFLVKLASATLTNITISVAIKICMIPGVTFSATSCWALVFKMSVNRWLDAGARINLRVVAIKGLFGVLQEGVIT